jgi:predicted DCC family thiol-disulfide oxidoreductase YuxK
METNTKKLTVVYDNECRTCSVTRSIGEKLDTANNLEFVGMHTDEGHALIAKHALKMEKSAYAISDDGTVTERAEMIRAVLGATGFFGRILGNMVRVLPKTVADRLYNFAAKHRVR